MQASSTHSKIKIAFLLAMLAAFVGALWLEWSTVGLPALGVDWIGAFRPAALNFLHGQTPYGAAFYNPPWVLLPLIPLALLPPIAGAVVMFALNLIAYIFVAYRLRINPLLIVFFVLFSRMLTISQNGNIEGMLALGFILPPQVGLFLLLAKPQFGIAVAVFVGVRALREKKFVKTFAPVTVAFLLSFALFGPWFLQVGILTHVGWNASIFPYGIPLGILLLGMAIWKNEICYAIAASPFFAPYLNAHTWAVVWLGLFALLERLHHGHRISTLLRLSHAASPGAPDGIG